MLFNNRPQLQSERPAYCNRKQRQRLIFLYTAYIFLRQLRPLYDFHGNFLVVVGNFQFFCKLPAKLPASSSKLTANGDNLIHFSAPFCLFSIPCPLAPRPIRKSRAKATQTVKHSLNEWQSQMTSLPNRSGKTKIKMGGHTMLRDRETASAFWVCCVDCQYYKSKKTPQVFFGSTICFSLVISAVLYKQKVNAGFDCITASILTNSSIIILLMRFRNKFTELRFIIETIPS